METYNKHPIKAPIDQVLGDVNAKEQKAMELAHEMAAMDRKCNEGVHANAPYKIGGYKAYIRHAHGDDYIELVRPAKIIGRELTKPGK